MIELAIDREFTQGWIERAFSGGTTTVTNGVLRTVGSGASSAMRDFWFPIIRGEVIEFECMARNNNGGDARMNIDAQDELGNSLLLDYIQVIGTNWNRYKIKVAVPFSVTKPYARVVLGKWASANSNVDAEYQTPILRTSAGHGVDLPLAYGLVRTNSGAPDLHPTYKRLGVASVVQLDANTVRVTLSKPIYNGILPNVLVTGSTGSPWIPLAGNFITGTSPTFDIKWSTGSAFGDVQAASMMVFFRVFW